MFNLRNISLVKKFLEKFITVRVRENRYVCAKITPTVMWGNYWSRGTDVDKYGYKWITDSWHEDLMRDAYHLWAKIEEHWYIERSLVKCYFGIFTITLKSVAVEVLSHEIDSHFLLGNAWPNRVYEAWTENGLVP